MKYNLQHSVYLHSGKSITHYLSMLDSLFMNHETYVTVMFESISWCGLYCNIDRFWCTSHYLRIFFFFL